MIGVLEERLELERQMVTEEEEKQGFLQLLVDFSQKYHEV